MNGEELTLARFRSGSRPDLSYRVVKDAATGELRCECEGFRFRRRCRHVKATEMVYDKRGRPAICPGCGGGTLAGSIQTYTRPVAVYFRFLSSSRIASSFLSIRAIRLLVSCGARTPAACISRRTLRRMRW